MDHQEAVNTLASERYLLGEMTDAERDSFEEHYFSCAECTEDLITGDKMRAGAQAGLIRSVQAPQARRRPWRLAIVVPWAAAASLALLAGFESSRAESLNHGLTSPMTISPATLRPATRGQELTVPAPAGGVVALAVDLGGSRFDGGLKYEIRSETGGVVGRGEAASPAPGAPLLLVIPSSLFRSSGRYLLTLRSAAGGAPEAGEYRFAVQML
jgi:hypothetical protein